MKQETRKKKRNQKGFTLVEMIVVIAIIGVLAAMMVPSLLGFVDKAHESNMNAAASGLGRGVEAVLLEPRFSAIDTGIYVAKVDASTGKRTEFNQTGTTGTDTSFAAELHKIAGDEYEKGSTIYIKVEKASSGSYPSLTNVVYAKSGAGADVGAATTASSKNVGIFPNN